MRNELIDIYDTFYSVSIAFNAYCGLLVSAIADEERSACGMRKDEYSGLLTISDLIFDVNKTALQQLDRLQEISEKFSNIE